MVENYAQTVSELEENLEKKSIEILDLQNILEEKEQILKEAYEQIKDQINHIKDLSDRLNKAKRNLFENKGSLNKVESHHTELIGFIDRIRNINSDSGFGKFLSSINNFKENLLKQKATLEVNLEYLVSQGLSQESLNYFKLFTDTFDAQTVIGLPTKEYLKEKIDISEDKYSNLSLLYSSHGGLALDCAIPNDLVVSTGITNKNNKSVRIGQEKEGKWHALGMAVWSDGSMYMGQWEQGKKEGHGRYYYNNGEYYEGQRHKNKKSGYGTMVYKDGTTKTGIWRKNKFVQ